MTIKLKFRLPVPSSKVTAVVTASEATVAQQVQDRGEDTQFLVDSKGAQIQECGQQYRDSCSKSSAAEIGLGES